MRQVVDYGNDPLFVDSYAKKWKFFDDEETIIRIGEIKNSVAFAEAVIMQWKKQAVLRGIEEAQEVEADKENLAKGLVI
jgi:hypothetical protein